MICSMHPRFEFQGGYVNLFCFYFILNARILPCKYLQPVLFKAFFLASPWMSCLVLPLEIKVRSAILEELPL